MAARDLCACHVQWGRLMAETNGFAPWKLVLGRLLSFPFGAFRPIFRGKPLVLGRVSTLGGKTRHYAPCHLGEFPATCHLSPEMMRLESTTEVLQPLVNVSIGGQWPATQRFSIQQVGRVMFSWWREPGFSLSTTALLPTQWSSWKSTLAFSTQYKLCTMNWTQYFYYYRGVSKNTGTPKSSI